VTATAQNRDQALDFAQAVSDYCYDQEQRATGDESEDDAARWGEAEGLANDLVDALRQLADVIER
jgi:hypothetical protein